MKIPPDYELTQEMIDLFAQVEAKKALLENIPVSAALINNLQRQSLLKSSLFSAKIEGNSLDISDLDGLEKLDPSLKEKLEVENIFSAFNFVRENPNRIIDKNFISDLHRIVMKGLSSDLGELRKKPSAIFNQFGFPVYMPPPPLQVNGLLEQLVDYINSDKKENILIKAALAHITFEKIHPFLDGNGRVGRLLYQALLAKGNYHFNWLLTLEEGINENKEEYYVYLDKNDATSFIEFSLSVLQACAQKVLDKFLKKEIISDDLLLPRRKEILDIIKDQKVASLDTIKRRFLKIPSRTLRYDLKQLEKSGFIVKIGSTRGAMYKVKNKK